MLDAGVDRAFEQRARLGGVVEIVAERIGNRFRHDDLRGEMDDLGDVVAGERLGHEIVVAEIADDQRRLVGHGPAKAGREIVEHDDLLAGVEQFQRHVAADVAGAARHEYGHEGLSVETIDPISGMLNAACG